MFSSVALASRLFESVCYMPTALEAAFSIRTNLGEERDNASQLLVKPLFSFFLSSLSAVNAWMNPLPISFLYITVFLQPSYDTICFQQWKTRIITCFNKKQATNTYHLHFVFLYRYVEICRFICLFVFQFPSSPSVLSVRQVSEDWAIGGE